MIKKLFIFISCLTALGCQNTATITDTAIHKTIEEESKFFFEVTEKEKRIDKIKELNA